MRFLRLLPLILLSALTADAQTRAEQIQAERQAKAATLAPANTNQVPAKDRLAFTKAFGIWNLTQTGSHGLSLRLGGLALGSGLALGPEYVFKRGDLYDPGLIWESYAIASLPGYYRLHSRLELPKLLDDRAFSSIAALRFDYPRLAYYGPGQDSRKTGRTDYRMQENAIELRAGFKPLKGMQVGLLGGYQRVNIGHGTDPGIAQTDRTYPVSQAPGLDRQTNFLSAGAFVQFDRRDQPLDPHAGTFLLADFENINASHGLAGSFNQYDFEAQQYFHYWNKRRVIATRIKSTLTTPHAGNSVPFYLEPRLGGANDLRGFGSYRFYDQNSVVATAEYRWSVMQPLDMAVFVDAGKVYRNWDTFSLSRIQTDIGFGLRVKVGSSVPLRIDTGFSREGVQIWLNFYNVF